MAHLHQQMFPPQYLDSNGFPIAYAHPGPPLASMSSMSLNNLTMKAVRVHRYDTSDTRPSQLNGGHRGETLSISAATGKLKTSQSLSMKAVRVHR